MLASQPCPVLSIAKVMEYEGRSLGGRKLFKSERAEENTGSVEEQGSC